MPLRISKTLLSELGIEILTLVEPCGDSALESGSMSFANVYNGRRLDVADVELLAHATPRIPDGGLAAPLRARGIEVHVIGDAFAPRQTLSATADGDMVDNAL